MRRRWLQRALALCAASAAPAWAAGHGSRDLRVFLPPDQAPYRSLILALRTYAPNLQIEGDGTPEPARPHVQLAVGPQGLRKALSSDARAPLLCALTSSQTYRKMLAGSPRESGSHTAIFAEASPVAQMQLIAALFERRVTVGVLLSDASLYLERSLRQAAQNAGLDLLVLALTDKQDPARALHQLSAAQVLLAVPDGQIYTADNLRAVLESTYRRGIPVVGFSPATVQAGTLATAYADPDDMGADIIDMLDSITTGSANLPEARYPRYWRVAVNESVARSLGLIVSDKVRNMGPRPAGR